MCVGVSEVLILPSDMKYFLSLVCVFTTLYLQLHYVGLLIPQLSAYCNSNSFAICFFLWGSLNCMTLALMSCLPCLISSLCLSCLEKNGHKKTSWIGKLFFFFGHKPGQKEHPRRGFSCLAAASIFVFSAVQLTYNSGTFPLFPKYIFFIEWEVTGKVRDLLFMTEDFKGSGICLYSMLTAWLCESWHGA